MTPEELRRVYDEACENRFAKFLECVTMPGAGEVNEACRDSGLRAVFEAGARAERDEDTLAKHSGNSTNREWHSVGAWLHPGDEIVMRAAPLAKAEG